MKHALTLTVCLLTTFGHVSFTQAGPLSGFLAKDGKTLYTIVAADNEPETAATGQVASVELKDHKDRRELPREKWPVVYDISQNDSFPYICKCPNCTKITEREGSESALTLTCMNKVAREIAKEYPEIIIQTFAYLSTECDPKTIKPEPNLFIRWCDLYTRSDCYRPMIALLTDLRRAVASETKALAYIVNPRRSYQTPEFLGKVIGHLRQAQQLAPEGTPYRLRVNKELITPLAVVLYKPETNPGLDRAEVLKQYEMLRNQQIEAYCRPAKQKEFKQLLSEDIKSLAG